MINMDSLLKNRPVWYFIGLCSLYLFVYLRKNVIIDSNAYIVVINLLVVSVPYVVLKIAKQQQYYQQVMISTCMLVWYAFYVLVPILSKNATSYVTEQLPITRYIPLGSSGRSRESGFRCVYMDRVFYFSTTHESERLYELYGDSVVNHIKVRLSIKKALPNVYYVDERFIDYL